MNGGLYFSPQKAKKLLKFKLSKRFKTSKPTITQQRKQKEFTLEAI
jgi:hypothetical protein